MLILSTFFFFFFKQKTAYEMLRSLVGSEMCIRDSCMLTRSVVIECKVLVAQCSLLGCRIRETALSHCYLNEADIDGTVRDAGANVFEGCRVEDIPKLSYAERALNL
eukprot:TRINITY_DN23380_c0_g1_i2.p1 TRINITY_DN23380_c0_g1~~TRINITY_DN23380_c0_g1_i2.p1  ORF type:complete len:107 (-),score=25.56 TRINITY_DN23380_c0_g1_i2:183-503(-)